MEKVNHAPEENHVFLSIRQLTVSGLLAGITIFLGLTGYGFIPLIVMNATILHIPTIIGALVAGPKVGALVGFLFGLFSFIQTLRAPSLLLQFALQYNPFYDAFICIVPRVCIGLFAWFLYKHMPGREGIRVGIAAVGGSLQHRPLPGFLLPSGRCSLCSIQGDFCGSCRCNHYGYRWHERCTGSHCFRCHHCTGGDHAEKIGLEDEIK